MCQRKRGQREWERQRKKKGKKNVRNEKERGVIKWEEKDRLNSLMENDTGEIRVSRKGILMWMKQTLRRWKTMKQC